MLQIVDKVEKELSFDGTVGFITNIKLGQFHGPRRHATNKVRLLEDLLNGVISFDDDGMVLEVGA